MMKNTNIDAFIWLILIVNYLLLWFFQNKQLNPQWVLVLVVGLYLSQIVFILSKKTR